MPINTQTGLVNLRTVNFFCGFSTKTCPILVSYFFRVWCCCLLLFPKISGSSLIDPSLIEKNVCSSMWLHQNLQVIVRLMKYVYVLHEVCRWYVLYLFTPKQFEEGWFYILSMEAYYKSTFFFYNETRSNNLLKIFSATK